MIKYNWQRVKKLCNFNTVNILQYFCFKEGIWLPNYLPKEYKHNIYISAKDPYPEGDSYILNIRTVLNNKVGFYIEEIYDYIHLASLRSYFEYKLRNDITLPLVIAKAGNMDLNNPLIKVINNRIHFKYETVEINRGNINGN